MARVRFGDRNSAKEETALFRELGEVRLVLLNKEVVTAPDRGEQRDGERASYCKGEALLAALRDLFGAKTLSLGQRLASKARVSTGLDNGNKDVVSKLDAAS